VTVARNESHFEFSLMDLHGDRTPERRRAVRLRQRPARTRSQIRNFLRNARFR
jgi:hypothetical protein